MTLLTNKEPNKPEPNKTTMIVALVVTAAIALAGIGVMAMAECGAELDVNILPLPHIRFERLACPPK